MTNSVLMNRRTCLQGLGAALALPLLETMAAEPNEGKTYKPPVRLGFMYMPVRRTSPRSGWGSCICPMA
jgi:hypothetical protein